MDPQIKPTSDYKKISIEDTFKFLEAVENGLSDVEVKRRLGVFGRNEIKEKKKNPLLEFFRRYWGPMPWLLELAMVLSILLGHKPEGIIIFALLTINASIGFMQSRGSQKAVELLKQRLAIKAKVLRNGEWKLIESSEIVPGDVVVVKLGDIAPADVKIINGDLSVDESALTGESLPAERHDSDIIYSGSVIRRGEGKCFVVNTGANTYFGKTAELVKIAKPKSHQEEIIIAIVKYLMYVGIAASLVVAVYAFLMKFSVIVILTFIVVFLIGAVPVALPTVMTIVQAVTGVKLVREGVLVTRLDSIEDAASISVLCLDKTGTITQNKLSVIDTVPFSGYKKEDVIRYAALSSITEGMDLIDTAIIDYANTSGISPDSQKQISYTPFNPAIKRTEAVVESDGKRCRVVKGATQIIRGMCKRLDVKSAEEIEKVVEGYSQKGYRALALAKSVEGDFDDLDFVGILLMADPPRPDSAQMIKEIKALGIKPMMLTGDNIAIAQEVSRQVGIGEKIICLSEIESLSEDEKMKAVSESDGVAEIYPEDKFRIVKLLQSRGHMVGMTGDGVNDAPALKQAEMGIAVSSSTDVAKVSASVVLTEPGVRVIVEAVKRSRDTYQRMLTWVINKVTKVIQVVGLLTVGFFMIHEMALSLLGMLLLVFANDFVSMSIATDNVKYTIDPDNWNVKKIMIASLFIGVLLVVEGIAAILWGVNYYHLNYQELQTFVMLMLIFTSQFNVLIVRERNFFWTSIPGKALLASTMGSLVVFTLIGIYGVIVTPLAWNQVVAALGFSAAFVLAIDFPKYYVFKKVGLG
ncbi:MAG: plasma-membrane proton-efflux P-type ATPase [Bacteroidetes bacterium]|nr:plasma-membrane proton-efflux P-type ATPase [Bacteroidota bacterium]MCL5737024.1 plasma-membrane proton-efflux P-type ATPase [Bacteroidota bacterium]